MPRPTTTTFGAFEFDHVKGSLTKNGRRIRLQPKAAAALACLLESPGELVSRTQLQKALWPEGTFVDFDLGIKTAVKKLREALDDSADQPKYVQTVYGEGFRFLAPVVRVEPASEVEPAQPGAGTAGAPQPKRRLAVGIAVLFVAALSLSPVGPDPDQLRFQKRDWVVIAAFENRTGESILDDSVEYALSSELARSPYVNVAPRDRIADALRLMRQSPQTKLTEDVAREVAIRDGGIRSVVSGGNRPAGPPR